MQKQAEVTRTGMIGLGAMGFQMARHMKNKGLKISGYDILGEAMQRAGREGIETRASVEDVARDSAVVVVMVQTDAQVEHVFRGGLLDALQPGSVVCIASSVSPDTCRRMEELAKPKGIGILDTPVVLGQEAANEGTLTVLAGGEEKWLDRARPVLSSFSARIQHVGPLGQGQVAKTINNMLLWACMCANLEALTLAKRLGADLPRLIEALAHSSGANWSLSRWGKSTGKWAEKDMDVALELAQQAKAPVPLAGLVDQLMKTVNQERMKALLD
jgi:3-hydroxyisobutyrate dehydrogenase-like beta-hydroxyacid dehydrogenase